MLKWKLLICDGSVCVMLLRRRTKSIQGYQFAFGCNDRKRRYLTSVSNGVCDEDKHVENLPNSSEFEGYVSKEREETVASVETTNAIVSRAKCELNRTIDIEDTVFVFVVFSNSLVCSLGIVGEVD
jgi:hypothetical protein